MSLTKYDLTELLYDQAGLTKKQAASIVESIFEIIKEELGKGNPVKM